MRYLVLALLLAAGTARADATLDGAAITALLTGHVVAYEDGSKQTFKAGGETVYDNGRLSSGQWQVRGDRYCSVWPPSDQWACYDVTQGDRVGFVADDGSVTRGHLVP